MAESFFIVDAFAHIYQFFFAIRGGLTGPDGEPVNAVYGFARMIESLRTKHNPDYLAVAFDGPGELERHRLYEDYKANRPPMPADLARQVPLIRELLEAQRVPQVAAEGHEADDVMAALARRAGQAGVEAVLVTTDKDAEQCIGEHVRVLHVHKDREEMLDPQALKDLKGIEPWQVVEVMALAGDTTDNVPGVPGVGPKTALKLIQEFGSVENLYANLDRVKGEKLRQKLAEHRRDVELAARLVRLDADIPVDLDLEECRTDRLDRDELSRFYQALGFRSLLQDEAARPARQAGAGPREGAQQAALFEAGAEEAAVLDTIATVEKRYSTVSSPEAVRRLAASLAGKDVVSVDLETTSLQVRDARIVGLAFSWEPDQGAYVPVAGPAGSEVCPVEEALAALRPVLEAEKPAKVGQNLKYDMAVLRNYDIALGGLRCDSMVASYLLRPSSRAHNLDALAARHLRYRPVKISELIGEGARQTTMDTVPVEKVAPYSCEDADLALQLCRLLSRELDENDLWDLFTALELPLVPVLASMEWVGVRVDVEHLAALSTEFAGKLEELERDIYREAGREFNVNSPQQLSAVLFEELGLPRRGGRRTTGFSTASDVLTALRNEHPIADYLLRHRELSKLKSTYADALTGMVNSRTGRIHTSFNQTVTATGRLSSSDPNLQNIPVRTPLGRRIRRAFVAGGEDMSLLSADYSQVELRIVAHCSEDPALRRAFEEDRDIHRFVAAQVNGIPEEDVTDQMRQQAKAVNFGILYGLSPYGLSNQIGVPVAEAEQFIAGYFGRYPRVKQFIDSTVAQAHRDGYVRTLAGRRRRIEGLKASGAARRAAERIAVNTVIQGTAADLIKRAMIDIHRGLHAVSARAQMLIQIHDELVFEAPDEDMDAVSRFVSEKMSGALKLSVPLRVDVSTGKNWADAK
jgi:DNA polymerase-1